MKTFKKTFSVILSVLMVLSVIPLAVSADVLTKEQFASEFSWSEDFENLTLQTVHNDWSIQLAGTANAPTLDENLYHEADGSHISYDIVNGVFGKADDDAALKYTTQIFGSNLTTDVFGGSYPAQFASSGEIRFFREAKMPYQTSSANGLASYNDAVIHYSTEFALENLTKSSSYGTRDIALAIDLYGDGGTDVSTSLSSSHRSRFDVIKFEGVAENSAPTVKVFGTTDSTLVLNQKKWHKLDLVIHSDLGMDLYINGVKWNNERYYKTGNAKAPLRGVSVMRWYSNNKKSSSSSGYTATPFYLDNTSTTLLFEEPQIGAYNPSYDTTKLYFDMENTEETNSTFVPEAYLGNMVIADKGVMTYKGVDGVFGKTGKVFEISNTSQPASKCAPYFQACKAAYTVAKDLVAGDKVRIAFSIADKSTAKSTRYLSIDGMDKPLQITTAGQVKFHGTAIEGLKVETGKWYNFELIYTKGASDFKADLYINGIKACDTKTVSKTLTIFENIRIGYEGAVLSSTDKTYKEDGIYIDDVIFEKYSGGNFAATPVTLSNASGDIKENISGVIEPGAKMTVSEFKTAVTVSGASSYKIVDRQGNEKSATDKAENGYLLLNTADKKVIIYELKAWEPMDGTNFDDVTLDNSGKILVMKAGNWNVETSKKGHTYSLVDGLSLKDAGDKALVMSTVDFNTSTEGYGASSKDPYLRYSFTDKITKTFSGELSVLLSGADTKAYIAVSHYQNDAHLGNLQIVDFEADGSIKIRDNKIGKWEQDRWYRVGFCCNPATGNTDVYFNGEKYTVETTYDPANGPISYANFRLSVDYPSNKTVSGYAAIDNFRVYEGEYIGDVSTSAVTSKDTVNNFVAGSEIYTKTISTVFDLASNLEYDADKTVIYSDETYADVLSDFAVIPSGAVMVVKDGNVCKYYKIVKLDSSYAPVIFADGREFDTLKNGKLTAKICTNLADNKGKLFLAVYIGNKLDKLVVKDLPAGFAVSETEAITLSGSLEGVTVRAFAFESYDSMSPVAGVAIK